jgi:amidase
VTDSPVDLPLPAVVALLRSGRVGSVDLVEECLDRIRADRRVNAVVELDADAARRQARRADELLRDGVTHLACVGVPVTVKRTYEVDGFVHTEHDVADGDPHGVPRRDADVVRLLRATGAVVLGRTNAPARAADIDTWHPEFGRTTNPHDPERGAGGSSGGSAAAVAAGHTAFDIGSDAAGSARIPAHSCGVLALRPTPGRLPTRGHVPGQGTARMLTSCPVTRSAEDLRHVWHALGGEPGTSLSRGPLAVSLSDSDTPMSGEVAESLWTAVAALRSAGFDVEDVPLPVSLRENWLLCQQLLYAEERPAGDRMSEVDGWCAEPAADAEPMEIAVWSAAMPAADRLRLDRRRTALGLVWRRFFDRYAALLVPVMATAALPSRDIRVPVLADRVVVAGREIPAFSLSTWCALASVAGLPAVSMPVVVPAGLPVGLQVISAPGTDSALVELVIRLAAVISPGVPAEVPS